MYWYTSIDPFIMDDDIIDSNAGLPQALQTNFAAVVHVASAPQPDSTTTAGAVSSVLLADLSVVTERVTSAPVPPAALADRAGYLYQLSARDCYVYPLSFTTLG
jgi:hypothetical protein